MSIVVVFSMKKKKGTETLTEIDGGWNSDINVLFKGTKVANGKTESSNVIIKDQEFKGEKKVKDNITQLNNHLKGKLVSFGVNRSRNRFIWLLPRIMDVRVLGQDREGKMGKLFSLFLKKIQIYSYLIKYKIKSKSGPTLCICAYLRQEILSNQQVLIFLLMLTTHYMLIFLFLPPVSLRIRWLRWWLLALECHFLEKKHDHFQAGILWLIRRAIYLPGLAQLDLDERARKHRPKCPHAFVFFSWVMTLRIFCFYRWSPCWNVGGKL